MGHPRFIFLATLLFFAKDGVSAQYATVLDCLSPGTATVLQSPSQYILPALIQPIISGYDSFAPEPLPNYGNSLAPFPGYPPIIVNDGDDLLRNLLYFLIFSMGNNRNNYNNMPPSTGCSCGCNKCQSCDCPNCKKNNNKDTYSDTSSSDTSSSAPIYIPVPIAIPVYTGPDGCRYIDGFCDDILVQESCGQYSSYNGRDARDEFNIVIRTDCPCSCSSCS